MAKLRGGSGGGESLGETRDALVFYGTRGRYRRYVCKSTCSIPRFGRPVSSSRGNRRSDAWLPTSYVYLYRPCSVIRATLQRPARDTIFRPSLSMVVARRNRRLKPQPRLTLTYAHRHNNGSGAWEYNIARSPDGRAITFVPQMR